MERVLTLIDIALLGVLLCEWVLHDDVFQSSLLKVLLAWRLVCAMLNRVLFHRLERKLFAPSHVVDVEEFVRLFTDFEKVIRRISNS